MASFASTPSQFNPYISQLPIVEEMSKVGMEKQAKYDQGLQRIQTQIDNVAGMDIMRDVDKRYMQSKMNELGNNLKYVAAGDFSNYQLTNSVGGMVNQIGKDDNIQNAVSSTLRVRQQQQLMKSAQKAGKSSPNREYDFNKDLSTYLNSSDLKQAYSGEYKEHVDVNKKVLDIIGKLHPNANIHDIPYAINKDGTLNTQVFAAAMQKQGQTGVNEGQIKSAVNAMLDPSDIDELASQGRYSYKDYNQQDLQGEATRSYTVNRIQYTEKLKELERQKLTTTNVEQQIGLNEGINYYKSLLGDTQTGIPSTLDIDHQHTMQSIVNNPDGARASLYTRNYLDNVANGFAYKDVKDEVLSNPAREDEWKRLNYNLSILKEQHDEAYRSKSLKIEEMKLGMEEQKIQIELNKLHPGIPSWKNKGNPSTNNLESMKYWNENNASMENSNKFILDDLAEKSSSMTVKVKPEDILKNIEAYNNNKYRPTDAYEKQQFDAYNLNSRNLATQHDIYKQKEDESYKEITGGLDQQQALNQQLSGIPKLRVGNTEFSAREVYDLLYKEKAHMSGVGPYAGTVSVLNDDELTPRERQLKVALGNRYSKVKSVFNQGATGNAETDAYLDNIFPVMGAFNDLHTKVVALTAEKMAPITGEFKQEQTSIDFKDNQSKLNFISDLSAIIQSDLGEKTATESYTPVNAANILQKKEAEDVDMQFVRQGGRYFVQLFDKANPKDIQLIPVTDEFVVNNPDLGSQYLNKNLDFAQTTLNNKGTTNIFKDYDHAYYTAGQFGSYINGVKTVTIPISADLEKRGGYTYPVFKLKTKDGDIIKLNNYTATDRSTFETEYLPSLTDRKIIDLFKTQYPDIEQLISQ